MYGSAPASSAARHSARLSRTGGESRPSSSDGPNGDIWSSLLDSVASEKRLPEKTLVVLGGSPDNQRDFVESLATDPSSVRRPADRSTGRIPPLANQYALGYTYRDVLDADQEDILARMSIYLLSEPVNSFVPLLKPLFTPQTLRNTLIVILLDWSQPWNWVRQLRDWIRLLRSLLVSLDDECKEVMEENMLAWRDRKRDVGGIDGGESSARSDGDVSIPLGPGEWEDALGVPLAVVCQNADTIEVLEKEQNWKEEEFDFVLQFLRTILLKHGASLIYTAPAAPNSLHSLIHSSLGIHSTLKRQPLKHNVVDRDKVLVPPNWDSWGKIRILREGFDVEGINSGWSVDLDGSSTRGSGTPASSPSAELGQPVGLTDSAKGAALPQYEQAVRDPRADRRRSASPTKRGNGHGAGLVESASTQAFLTQQVAVIERIKAEEIQRQVSKGEDGSQQQSIKPSLASGIDDAMDDDTHDGNTGNSRVHEHIGPVQFNVGGIQVDADDMLKRLKDRDANRSPEPTTPGPSTAGAAATATPTSATPDGKSQNEALASFFAGLIKRGAGSAANSPRS
ncbi:MAG: hypothetical protein M1825_001294 [Sarcosagium campestre]|nr:MAG: hypothetical protein M1825_001294 [Sarcosagium campestre]